jgi:hypothetical protein
MVGHEAAWWVPVPFLRALNGEADPGSFADLSAQPTQSVRDLLA